MQVRFIISVHLRIYFSMQSDQAAQSLKEKTSKYKLIQPKLGEENIPSD